MTDTQFLIVCAACSSAWLYAGIVIGFLIERRKWAGRGQIELTPNVLRALAADITDAAQAIEQSRNDVAQQSHTPVIANPSPAVSGEVEEGFPQ